MGNQYNTEKRFQIFRSISAFLTFCLIDMLPVLRAISFDHGLMAGTTKY
jgi:hypothetical protein